MRMRFSQVSGVPAVAVVNHQPLGNSMTVGPVHGAVNFTAYSSKLRRAILPRFQFHSLTGRDFHEDDQDVAIVSESFAQKLWPGKDPLPRNTRMPEKK